MAAHTSHCDWGSGSACCLLSASPSSRGKGKEVTALSSPPDTGAEEGEAEGGSPLVDITHPRRGDKGPPDPQSSLVCWISAGISFFFALDVWGPD